MSRENVEIVRRAYDSFNRRNVEAFLSHIDPNAEWLDDPRVPGATTRRGEAEIRRYVESLSKFWEPFCLVAERLIDRGEEVVVLGRVKARGASSGVVVERELDQILTVQAGRIVRGRTLSSREEALEAAGLSE